jgi:hypothetical protein
LKIPVLRIIIGVVLAAIAIFFIFNLHPIMPPPQKYDISVTPILVKDSGGMETRVIVTNTGRDALTNVTINYGGTARPAIIPVLNPGSRIASSPPLDGNLTAVQVTTDQGINVIQPYTTANAPFVGNSVHGG